MRALILIALLLFPVQAGAELVYRGMETLWQDTVWEGEVLIDGILTVAPEVTLEIRPGTVVRFTPMDSFGDGIGEHEIFIQGRLKAVGTAEQPIRFTSSDPNPGPASWGAINMMLSEDEENLLVHCIIEYAYRGFHAHFSRARVSDSLLRRNMRGFQFQESTVVIERCRVEDNVNGLQFRDSTVLLKDTWVSGSFWGVRCVYSEVDLVDCRIENNLINGVNLRDSTLRAQGNLIIGNRRGLYLQRSQGTVHGNLVTDSSEHGIFLEESDVVITGNRILANGRSGVRWLNAQGRLEGNHIEGNGLYAVSNEGDTPLAAAGNWWGTADPQEIALLARAASADEQRGAILLQNPLPVAPVLEVPHL
ncbi:right-handed parallel beta-helix repeat-containing protein [Geoalkalibacter halelectricus]|uniref:Right-handed parallel beta-helix repeat-containing protein n=1 Tax=Geoalkalibacter halelectricus TaxID=2847045 RepID=A0ABY5ZIL2_9BACT|nr:right-handed parallel beta-helix repeat-containing protein [Geoalkalibacter halelectricus]MDO3379633.1 right-handed parallel beta-helix repeat-containing protein [Geoalkalibacter halelectricus]UWZ78551.1 right-handed parallel beta-helix repeat-containing protein [Geoalkalibacter halelectricus]